MTIMEALSWANNKLKITSGIEAPMLDAQLLLAYVFNTSKSYLFTHFSQELTERELERFENLMRRREHHEPIAYILGQKEFYGRSFLVNPFVLIPRPETELLVELAREAGREEGDTLYLDIGTGSGAIAVSLAAETGRPVIGVDMSTRALSVAAHNAQSLGVENRVRFLQGSLLEPIERQMVKPLHAVILCANLPYLTTRQWQEAPPDVKNFEPREALEGGVDGLDLYNALFSQLCARRTDFPDRLLVFIEIDPAQHKNAPSLVRSFFPHAHVEVVNDLAKRARVVSVDLTPRG